MRFKFMNTYAGDVSVQLKLKTPGRNSKSHLTFFRRAWDYMNLRLRLINTFRPEYLNDPSGSRKKIASRMTYRGLYSCQGGSRLWIPWTMEKEAVSFSTWSEPSLRISSSLCQSIRSDIHTLLLKSTATIYSPLQAMFWKTNNQTCPIRKMSINQVHDIAISYRYHRFYRRVAAVRNKTKRRIDYIDKLFKKSRWFQIWSFDRFMTEPFRGLILFKQKNENYFELYCPIEIENLLQFFEKPHFIIEALLCFSSRLIIVGPWVWRAWRGTRGRSGARPDN